MNPWGHLGVSTKIRSLTALSFVGSGASAEGRVGCGWMRCSFLDISPQRKPKNQGRRLVQSGHSDANWTGSCDHVLTAKIYRSLSSGQRLFDTSGVVRSRTASATACPVHAQTDKMAEGAQSEAQSEQPMREGVDIDREVDSRQN